MRIYTRVSACDQTQGGAPLLIFLLITHYARPFDATKAFLGGAFGSAGSAVVTIANEVNALRPAHGVSGFADTGTGDAIIGVRILAASMVATTTTVRIRLKILACPIARAIPAD